MSIVTPHQTDITSPPKAARVHLGWLDSLRALAALYVVMSHVIGMVNPDISHYRGLILLTAGPFRYGQAAVGLFIVLSGFSLMIPVTRSGGVLRGGAWKFFGRRAKRIVPPYYAAVGLSLLFIHFLIGHKTGTQWDFALPVTRADVWTHLLLVQDLFSHFKINNAFWSISVEWRIYFTFPILILLFTKYGGEKVVLGMLAVVLLIILGFQHSLTSLLYGTRPSFFALFAIGMLACEIGLGQQKKLCEIRDRVSWFAVWVPVWFIYIVLNFVWRGNLTLPQVFVLDTVNGILSAVLLIALSKPGPSRVRNLLSWRPLVFVGTFAYSIYLIHMPIAQTVWEYGARPLHKGFLPTYFIMVFVGLPIVVGASYLFFLAFERPFLNTKKRETLAETARDAALSPAP